MQRERVCVEVMGKKLILHLCADIGSDSQPYREHPNYEVVCIGKDIGIENYCPTSEVYGVIANPPCTEFSTARKDGKARSPEVGMRLVNECHRIILQANPTFFVIENPAKGALKSYLGKPVY